MKLVNKLGIAATGVALSIAAVGAKPAQAASVTISNSYSYEGTTAGQPRWNRPVANGSDAPTTLSSFANDVQYSTFEFEVSKSGSYDFLSTAKNGWDNYLWLYQNSFNPNQALANALIGNDDFPYIGVSGLTKSLSSGVKYFLVTTGFENSDEGKFTNRISMSTAVPEPLTMGGTAVALGMGYWMKRKKAASQASQN